MKPIQKIQQSVILAYPTTNQIVLSGYQEIPLRQFINIGDGFIIEDGAIKCLKDGIIEISATLAFDAIKIAETKWLEVRKTNNDPLLLVPSYCTANRFVISGSPILFKINSGEKIIFKVEGDSGDIVRGDASYTRICVKYLSN